MPGLGAEEAREYFAAARVARLATVDPGGRPHLVPVVFAVDGDRIRMAVDHKPKRTTALKRLANIAARPGVCLLADHYEEDWEQLWWVRADGVARVFGPQAEPAARTARLLADRYPRQYGDRPPQGPVTEVRVERWSGWRA